MTKPAINIYESRVVHGPPIVGYSRERLVRVMAPTIYCPSSQVERCLRSATPREVT
jgi:hypothetical protein